MIPVPVAFHLDWHAAWHCTWHPVWRNPCASEFCDTNGHALSTETAGEAGDNRCDDLGVRMGVAVQLVTPAVDFAA
jgi:hypothetical protein